jgi:hypothetical protein
MQAYDTLVKQLVTDEIMPWPLAHGDLYRQFLDTQFGAKEAKRVQEWWDLLQLRVTEKNIRVVAKCYSRIRTARLAGLVGRDQEAAERILSGMVCVRDAEVRASRLKCLLRMRAPAKCCCWLLLLLLAAAGCCCCCCCCWLLLLAAAAALLLLAAAGCCCCCCCCCSSFAIFVNDTPENAALVFGVCAFFLLLAHLLSFDDSLTIASRFALLVLFCFCFVCFCCCCCCCCCFYYCCGLFCGAAKAEPLYARIDRPAGTISFRKTQPAEAVLTAWTSDIGEMMQLVERTKHLIDREKMVHAPR